jgi:hypothetical protein
MDPVAHSNGHTGEILLSSRVDLLIAEYNSLLDRLEPLCVVTPTGGRENTLWFHPHEVDAVNSVWRSEGISGVARIWGAERAVNSSLPEGEANLAYLLIWEPCYSVQPDQKQARYFRRRDFEAPPSFAVEFIEALKSTGLYERLVPRRDSIGDFDVWLLPVSSVRCAADWYGPENPYGNGSEIKVSIGLRVGPDRDIDVRISFLKDAHMHVCLFDPTLYETGYEGHDHKVAPITVTGLRGILPVLLQIPAMTPIDPKGFAVGAWRGETYSQPK